MAVFRGLQISGDDAVSFLSALLTADLSDLADDRLKLAAWCDPKGRVESLLRLARHDDGVLVVCHESLLATLRQRLQLFKLRSAVTISEQDRLAIVSRTDATNTSSALVLHDVLHEFVFVFDDPNTDDHEDDWWNACIEHGVPHFSAELSAEFLPQMLNLQTWAGVSFDKGCYPGQEVIARVHYRGEVKRHLAILRGDAESLEIGSKLTDPNDARAGIVTALGRGQHGSRLQAVIDAGAGNEFHAKGGGVLTLERVFNS